MFELTFLAAAGRGPEAEDRTHDVLWKLDAAVDHAEAHATMAFDKSFESAGIDDLGHVIVERRVRFRNEAFGQHSDSCTRSEQRQGSLTPAVPNSCVQWLLVSAVLQTNVRTVFDQKLHDSAVFFISAGRVQRIHPGMTRQIWIGSSLKEDLTHILASSGHGIR